MGKFIFSFAPVICPAGTNDHSPAFQRRVVTQNKLSPGGTAGIDARFRPSRRDLTHKPIRSRRWNAGLFSGCPCGTKLSAPISFCFQATGGTNFSSRLS